MKLMSKKSRQAVPLVATLVLLGAGCGTGRTEDSVPAAGSSQGQALEAMPFGSLRDWRDYADQVSVVEVLEEHERLPSEEKIARGEYMIGRSVTIRVQETLWSRHRPIVEATLGTTGWMFSEAKGRREIYVETSPRLLPGNDYIVALRSDGAGEVSLQTSSSVLPLSDGQVVEGPTKSEKAQQFLGLTASDLRSQLDELPPDPLVERFADYAPTDRFLLVSAEKDPPGSESDKFTTTTNP